MADFKDKFISLLEQDETDDLGAIPSPERAAMAGTLDKDVAPEQYDVPAPRASIDIENKQREIEELKGWIAKVDNFIDFLNAPNQESMQSKLHAAPCKSLFERMAGSEKKKISRMAADLGSFNQTLKGYLIGGNE
jgi:hypothetical protein